METSAKELRFEEAAAIRDQVLELKKLLVAENPLVPSEWLHSSQKQGASVHGSALGTPASASTGQRPGSPKASRPGRSRGRR